MFVDIENFKSPLAIENLLIPYKRGRLAPDKKSYLPKEPITPDVCWEVLKSTNAPRSIKDMLSCIADLPPSEQAQFKDVVLSTFDNREQPDEVLELGKILAETNGYMQEFDENREYKEGDFLVSMAKPAKSYLHLKGLGILSEDFSHYDMLICRGGTPYFAYVKKMPKTLKFEDCVTVRLEQNALQGLENIYCCKVDTLYISGGESLYKIGGDVTLKRIELDDCDMVTLNNMVFTQSQNLKFSNVNNLKLANLKNFSMPSSFVDLSSVILDNVVFDEHVKSLKFQNMTGVQINNVYAPDVVELENVKSFAANADFNATKTLRLKNVKKVDLSAAKNLSDIIVSGSERIDFAYANFTSDSHLELKDIAHVSISYVSQMPNTLTVTNCTKFEAFRTDFNGVNFMPSNVCDMSLVGAVNLPSLTILSAMDKLNIDCAEFADGQKLVAVGVKNIKAPSLKNAPELIKISHTEEIDLRFADLSKTKKIAIDDAETVWACVNRASAEFTASRCRLVSFSHGHFNQQTKVNLQQVKKAEFDLCEVLPEELDVSGADDVRFSTLNGVKKLVLRDETQKMHINSNVFDNFYGDLVYSSPDANKANINYRQEIIDRYEAQREAARQQQEKAKKINIWARIFGKDRR